MIKVVHLTSVHPREDVRIFTKECVSLANAGYDVTLVQQGESCEKCGVHILGFGKVDTSRIKRMLFTSSRAYKVAISVDADIYHLHDPELLPYALKLKKKGKKVIFDSHEHTAEAILEKTWLPSFIRRTVYRLYSSYQKHICSKIDAVVTVTPNIVNYFSAFQPNTVQIANFPIYSEDGHNDSAPKKKRAAFAGGISEQWNHHVFLEALKNVPECRYCLCGASSPEYLDLLKSHDSWERVDYLGKIPHSKVASELAQSTVGLALLRPGRNTDFANGTIGNTKIFEEMMASLPVICTDFVLWKEFVDRYNCGICVDPSDPEQIADALKFLIQNPEKAEEMGRNGRHAVKEEFNWAVEEKKLISLYRSLS